MARTKKRSTKKKTTKKPARSKRTGRFIKK